MTHLEDEKKIVERIAKTKNQMKEALELVGKLDKIAADNGRTIAAFSMDNTVFSINNFFYTRLDRLRTELAILRGE